MKPISTNELRELYQKFFESKGHVRIPSAPLVPENDPSVLFTTAGMHPLVPYLKGQPHPAGKRLVDVQKSLRTTDIDEVGDATHATVFEMLGNWSLGDYFKKDAIAYSWEFLTSAKWLGLDPNYLAVSVFAGDGETPRDEESAATWKAIGIAEGRIAYLGVDDNWWPAGARQAGPQGPDTEMFYWTGEEAPPEKFEPTDKRWVEIWNDVFMQFNRDEKGNLTELPQKNVDTGMGLERTVMILNGKQSIYEIDSFEPLLNLIDKYTKQTDERSRRILADHIKAATFVLGDDIPVVPGNKDQGYVLRRIIRRAVLALRDLGVGGIEVPASKILIEGARHIIDQYGSVYPSLLRHADVVREELKKEVDKFDLAVDRGLSELDKRMKGMNSASEMSGQVAFDLYQTYGLPAEMTREVMHKVGIRETSNYVQEFHALLGQHQEQSRTAAAGMFKGGLADHSEMSVKYHTATHLLHKALQDVLGKHAVQKGSNITAERLRFDFSHPEKLTAGELQKVAEIVNEKIKADLPVRREEMTVDEARARGALGLFAEKYGERVNVYMIGDYSIEICGGPHVERIGGLGMFLIQKEESAGAGVRRIKAVLQ